MRTLQKYALVAGVAFVAGLAAMYAALRGSTSDTLSPSVAIVPTHTVEPTVPLVAQDKPALRKADAISKKTEQAPGKEVLASGKVSDDSGTKHVAAVLDLPSGTTQLTTERPWAEWMSRHELGAGFGLVDGEMARAAQYRWTFGRVWSFYATAQVEVFEVDRDAERHPWNAMFYGTVRF